MMIFGLINKNSGPGFHRIQMPLEFMRDTDVYVTNAVEEEDFEKKRPDWIYYNRTMSDEVLRLQSKYHFRVAVDVDDWWHLDPHHIMFKYSRDNNIPAHQIKHLRIADVVTCTHERLAERVYEFNKNIVIVPNAIPSQCEYFPTIHTPTRTGKRRIFWQGSVTHKADLNLLRSTIKKLEHDKFMMVMAGYTKEVEWERMADYFTNYQRLSNVVLPGASPMEYYQAYQYADIAVVPLLSTKFNQYKSNLKILEAANMGIPVIASNVHPYKNIPGVMYADRKEDWGRWLRESDEVLSRNAAILSAHCQEHFNFDTINMKRRQMFET